jgi:excinuclease ABC subunit B
VANVIEEAKTNSVLAHNKTLAAQLYLNSNNSFQTMVEYFVSYYDYYQPEAFMPVTGVLLRRIYP